MKRTRWAFAALAAGSALAVGSGVAPSAAATKQSAASADAGLTRFQHQSVAWHGCQRGPDDHDGQTLDEAGAQCADITVPLDYRHPDRRTITVAISRLRATDTAGRIGPLVINLGGPGNPVLASIVLARQAMGATGARFDLIGMDVRFTGRSTPLDCGWPSGWLSRSAGVDRRGFDRMTRLVRDLAGRCGRRQAAVLPYASTANTARDMDVVRAALGEPRVSFLGYSQGSYLGAIYTQLFPRRADRMVLDSAIDPTRPGTRILRENGTQREAALRDWADWAAQRDDQYHLGRTVADVMATVNRTYHAAARRPLRVGRYSVDDTLVAALLIDPLTDDTDEANAELATTVQTLAQAAAGHAVTPSDALDRSLAGLLTGADSPAHSAQTAILCGDAAVSRDPEWYWRDIQAHRAAAPLFGPQARTITPCAFWPNEPAEAPVRIHNDRPALVVNAAGDVNSTLEMGQAMHRALSGSRMITLQGVRTHGVYLFQGAACVDDAVNAYLNTGTPPAHDIGCPRPS
ncbi:MAG TPA: alpha/beta fold hydrolase [Streptosporangiaceae bacterium]|jgi:pimeloyl-ACP methyl ester carboxylesterase